MGAKLFLVGVGPGDPELMTLKAARIIGEANCVSFPQKPGSSSCSYEIAQSYLSENAELLPIILPMEISRNPAKMAYDQAAIKISERLDAGISVAYLCEGDPLFYGSAMYLLQRLHDQYDIEIIPGVTSLGAASAALGRPLVARSERLKTLPGTLDDKVLRAELAAGETVAILKLGRHLNRIRKVLLETGHAKNAWIVESASADTQRVMRLVDFTGSELPYFSIVLCYVGAEKWQDENWINTGDKN